MSCGASNTKCHGHGRAIGWVALAQHSLTHQPVLVAFTVRVEEGEDGGGGGLGAPHPRPHEALALRVPDHAHLLDLGQLLAVAPCETKKTTSDIYACRIVQVHSNKSSSSSIFLKFHEKGTKKVELLLHNHGDPVDLRLYFVVLDFGIPLCRSPSMLILPHLQLGK